MMKRLIIAVVFGVASLSSVSTQAQISLNVNIGSQPQWGPSGYNHVDYYYLPDIDAYYNVPAKQYVYMQNGSWVFRKTLPARYSNYDLYSAYKVVMNTPKPYLSHQTHIRQYSKYKNYRGKQVNLRDSRSIKPGNNGRNDNNNRPGDHRDSRNNNQAGRNNRNDGRR